MDLLPDGGADVNAYDSYGSTPLRSAALNGNIPMVRALLERGADVNAGEEDYRVWLGSFQGTPLVSAAIEGRIDMTKLLLDSGAEIEGEFGEEQFSDAVRLAKKGVISPWLGC